MNAPIHCYHKFDVFQAHENCQQLAMICESKCQPMHKSNNPICLITSADLINMFQLQSKQVQTYLQECYAQTKNEIDAIIKQVKSFRDKYFNNIKFTIVDLATKNAPSGQELYTKLQNQRYDQVRCHELFLFQNNRGYKITQKEIVQQRMKNYLEDIKNRKDIIKKFLDPLQDSYILFQKFSANNAAIQQKIQKLQKQKQDSVRVLAKTKRLQQEKDRQNKNLEARIIALINQNKQSQYQKKRLNQQINKYKNTLQNLIGQIQYIKSSQKQSKLSLKPSFNIYQVITKKIKKRKKIINPYIKKQQILDPRVGNRPDQIQY